MIDKFFNALPNYYKFNSRFSYAFCKNETASPYLTLDIRHGRSQDFFGGGDTFRKF